jgi:hypothetical protein
MKITDADRQAAITERQSRPKMTERAKATLRERNEADRRNEVEEARVCAEFLKLRRDVPNFEHNLRRIYGVGGERSAAYTDERSLRHRLPCHADSRRRDDERFGNSTKR